MYKRKFQNSWSILNTWNKCVNNTKNTKSEYCSQGKNNNHKIENKHLDLAIIKNKIPTNKFIQEHIIITAYTQTRISAKGWQQ